MDELFDATAAVRLAENPSKAIKQRLAKQAEELNLAGRLAARLSVANEGLFKLTQLVYAADTDGGFANADPATGAILIPLPWGRVGHIHYRLRRAEADICRLILLERQRATEKMKAADRAKFRPQLFYYAPDWRRWFANLDAYPTFEQAQQWLQPGPLTLQEWRLTTVKLSQKRAVR